MYQIHPSYGILLCMAEGGTDVGPPSVTDGCRVLGEHRQVTVIRVTCNGAAARLIFVHNELYITLFIMFYISRLNLFNLGL